MLIDTGKIAPERIGIIGGSYGGYMVCAAMAFRPDEFKVGVDIFGVTNWARTLKEIPPWWESMKKSLEKEMGDFSDMEYFKKISPLFHAGNITRPLMVLQGKNDPRVLQVESDDWSPRFARTAYTLNIWSLTTKAMDFVRRKISWRPMPRY